MESGISVKKIPWVFRNFLWNFWLMVQESGITATRMGRNVFGKFPQQGYSGDHAGLPDTAGNLYDCAASAVWRQDNVLKLKVQIIDRYLGSLFVIFAFRDDLAAVTMEKYAEAFLGEYQGTLVAKRV